MRTLSAVVLTTGLVLAGSVASAWAFGELGHKIVCEIAFNELTPKAREAVIRLVKQDDEFKLFADSCTWPDNPRSRDAEHFVNVPRNFGKFSGDQCPMAPACLLTAIRKDAEVLRTSTDDQERLKALKYLGYWVGDVHQPLHVSFEDDRGGGKIREIGPCLYSLHAVWDACIIEQRLGTNVRQVAFVLIEEITKAEREQWAAAPPHEWANESLAITRRPSVGYCVWEGNRCSYAPGRPRFAPGQPEKAVKVGPAYLDAHMFVVAERLKRAGVRLGHLLNQVLDQ